VTNLIIKNGTVVTAEGRQQADVLIRDGRVAAVGPNLPVEAGDGVLDAAGCLVLPGLVDAHVHLALDTGIYRTDDDFGIGTRSAACGGVTTIVDFATQLAGMRPVEAVAGRMAEADPLVHIDYALHCMITDFPVGAEPSLADLVAAGVPPTTTVIVAARAYLQTQQNSDGGFPVRAGGASNAPSTAYAVMGLVAIGENPLAPTWRQSGGSPIDALLRAQSAAGGLAGTSGDNDLQATAQSIPALMGRFYPILGRRVAVNRATAWLRTQQAVSGQFGFGAGSTIDALFVIAALGQDPTTWRRPGGQSPLDYLAAQADTYSAAGAAQTAKLIVGLNAVGVDPQGFGGVDLPARLAAAETAPGVYGGPTAQAWATLALRVLARPAASAATTLRGQQRPDGGWSFSPSDASDTNTTALALQALAAAGEPLDGTLVISATGYLHTRQALDGGFPYQADDADTNSTAVVLQALTALRADGDSLGWTTHLTATNSITLTAHTPVDWLLGQQTPSGAFPFFDADSDFATLQVIPALLDRPLPVVLRRLHLPLVQRGSNLSQPR